MIMEGDMMIQLGVGRVMMPHQVVGAEASMMGVLEEWMKSHLGISLHLSQLEEVGVVEGVVVEGEAIEGKVVGIEGDMGVEVEGEAEGEEVVKEGGEVAVGVIEGGMAVEAGQEVIGVTRPRRSLEKGVTLTWPRRGGLEDRALIEAAAVVVVVVDSGADVEASSSREEEEVEAMMVSAIYSENYLEQLDIL